MTENIITFPALTWEVINQLKEHHYKDSTLDIYRRIYNRVFEFMTQNGIAEYAVETGEAFLAGTNVSKATFTEYSCVIRRLNDFVNGRSYRCHRNDNEETVPEIYSSILDSYLGECISEGNKPPTIKFKRKTCISFLSYIEQAGCSDIARWNTEIVSRTLLIYSNKDRYAIIRMFLRHLFLNGYTGQDFSRIVPRYKRRSVIPTTYTVSEILRIEDSVDTETDVGKRDLAIIRLATRMGLRSGDIAKLRNEEIDFQSGYISLCQEKTGIPLALRMPEEVSAAIIQHLENLGLSAEDDGYVFHSMSAPYGPITTSIIRHLVTKYLKAAGIDTAGRKHGPHAFRSSLASSMINDGASYETVRKILGHSDPDVIKHYAKIDVESLRMCALEPPEPAGIFMDYLSGKKVARNV